MTFSMSGTTWALKFLFKKKNVKHFTHQNYVKTST